ncbi:hypothetical protein Hanom_Chr15g01408481 [Helianthus anomalus]
MEKEYEEAKNYRRYDKERVFDDVLVVIPLSGEYYSNVAKDKYFEKELDKIIKDVMTASLRQRDEERMKKNVEIWWMN